MSVIVQKYGGSSVATPEKLRRVAELVVKRKRTDFAVVEEHGREAGVH